ncbi:Stk1 family PASTA domain-containing Ser/Thr kinase [Umezawaea beigongshangensis]|uniref:Stk1 family PASTA domain-containing Ser/Thr kinase n=1 Tax=Umezawaea beigongshangensis TaxID=2780383 RepID=UPI0018F25437|nr:Stk1 family PASTA domain-containing Ser/Thr kinase [Umezawaea beigongshangensis]
MSTPRLLSNRYELGETLGYGGMSEVHKGRDVRLSRDVAVKVLRADLARDPQFQERFRREAQNAAALNHPAIVAVYDTGETTTEYGPLPYIVMEYVDGRTLRDIVKTQGPLSNKRAMEVMADVSAALDFSHRHGIVHRDVKPANVMITRAGAVKVMDFGIARAVHDGQAAVTQTAAVIGTAQYLSPEQARGEAVDGRSDVYASGCVLFELLTGEPPFTGDSPVAVAYQHVREDPKSPSSLNPQVSPALDAIVLKAMAKGPANRYQSAAEMRADLVRVLSGQRPSAPAVMTAEDRTAVLNQQPQRTEVVSSGGRHRPSALRDEPDDYDDLTAEEEELRRVRRKKSMMIALVVLLCIAVLALAVWITTTLMGPKDSAPTNTVEVPDVVGQQETVARDQLQRAGLVVVLEQIPCQEGSVPACGEDDLGRVLETDPAAGRPVDKQTRVTMRVGANPEKVDVPALLGMTIQDAQAALEGVGLKLAADSPQVETEDAALVGNVAEQGTAPGVKLAKGSQVAVKIGRAPDKINLVGVVGQTVANATATLQREGLEVQTQEVDSAEEEGIVIGQDPRPGKVDKGTVVTLSVSRGNQIIVVDLTNLSLNDARNKLRATGWEGNLEEGEETRVTDQNKNNKVQSQSVPAGTKITKNQSVTVSLGDFSIVPPTSTSTN